jgi:hypothetical protein
MGLLDLEEISADPGRMGLLMMGLGMMANGGRNASFNDAIGGGMQGLLSGQRQAMLQSKMNRDFADSQYKRQIEMEDRAYKQQERQREMAQLDALKNIDINDPESANQLARLGSIDAALKLRKFQDPAKEADPYYQAVPTSDGYMAFNARTGGFSPLMMDGKALKQPTADPNLQGEITASKESNKIDNITTSDGRTIPVRMGDVVGSKAGSITPVYEKALLRAYNQDDDPELKAWAASEIEGIASKQNIQPQAEPMQIGQTTEGKAYQTEIGKAEAERQAKGQQSLYDAEQADVLLQQAKDLIGQSTGGDIGKMYDRTARYFGKSTPGSQAIAKLKLLSGRMTALMPKMSGPQSDRDVEMYKQMAGDLGNPDLPIEDRQAAWDQLSQLNKIIKQRYGKAGQPASQPRQGLLSVPDQAPLNPEDLMKLYLGGN